MKIGYVRVSTEEQSTARQETLMKEMGNKTVTINLNKAVQICTEV